MFSNLYFSKELIQKLINKLTDQSIEINFDNKEILVNTRIKNLDITAVLEIKSLINNIVIMEITNVKSFMPDFLTNAATGIFRGKINDLAESKLPEFIQVQYPVIKIDLNKIKLNQNLYLTDIGNIIDIKPDEGITVIMDI